IRGSQPVVRVPLGVRKGPAGGMRNLSCPALTASLRELASQIPQLKKDIQEGLLKMLSVVLMRRSLRHPGMPKHLANQAPSSGHGLDWPYVKSGSAYDGALSSRINDINKQHEEFIQNFVVQNQRYLLKNIN
ncbi:hypothetical protein AVEN_264640-1, partial [Araneus ventricosus]